MHRAFAWVSILVLLPLSGCLGDDETGTDDLAEAPPPAPLPTPARYVLEDTLHFDLAYWIATESGLGQGHVLYIMQDENATLTALNVTLTWTAQPTQVDPRVQVRQCACEPEVGTSPFFVAAKDLTPVEPWFAVSLYTDTGATVAPDLDISATVQVEYAEKPAKDPMIRPRTGSPI